MRIPGKRLAGFLLAAICLASANASSSKDTDVWRLMEKAEYAFEKGEIGEALELCDKARAVHMATYEEYSAIVIKAVAPYEVKKAGDDLDAVYSILTKRNDYSAVSVLDAIYLLHPPAYFGKSLQKLQSWLSLRAVYPEADMLTARIYEAEGEYPVALSFYEKAWQERAFLEVPDDRFTIAYGMADIAKRSGRYGDQERYLLLVLTDDAIFGVPGKESPTLEAMIRSIKSDDTMTKFFSLYRHDNMTALKAYQDLFTVYFTISGKRIDRAYPVATLASCISLTVLSNAITATDFEYIYANFDDLLKKCARSKQIVQWAKDSRLWDSFMMLASAMDESGETAQSQILWNSLASYCPDPVIARKASGELSAAESRKSRRLIP